MKQEIDMFKQDLVLTKLILINRIVSMQKVITIHEAKTHLSKYIKQAQTGRPVYIGGYGRAEVMLVPAIAPKKTFNIGAWQNKPIGYGDDVVESDPDILKDFEDSINKPFPDE